MIEWLLVGSIKNDDEIMYNSETTTYEYCDERTYLFKKNMNKSELVTILYRRYLGTVSKSLLNKKSKEHLLTEVGIKTKK